MFRMWQNSDLISSMTWLSNCLILSMIYVKDLLKVQVRLKKVTRVGVTLWTLSLEMTGDRCRWWKPELRIFIIARKSNDLRAKELKLVFPNWRAFVEMFTLCGEIAKWKVFSTFMKSRSYTSESVGLCRADQHICLMYIPSIKTLTIEWIIRDFSLTSWYPDFTSLSHMVSYARQCMIPRAHILDSMSLQLIYIIKITAFQTNKFRAEKELWLVTSELLFLKWFARYSARSSLTGS